MSETAPTPTPTTEAIAPVLPCPINYDPNNGATLLLDSAVFAQIQRVGKMLSASEMVPTHLRGKAADCALVVAQAFRWGLDPLAVAQSTYVVQGKYGYEGKLIAALVNTSGRTKGPLAYSYTGEGRKRRVVVAATLKGEDAAREITGTVDDWATNNEKWTKTPDAMLRYRGAREWARAHMPEVILGIQSDDEVEQAPVVLGGMSAGAAAAAGLASYAPDPLAEQLKAQRQAKATAAPEPVTADPEVKKLKAMVAKDVAEVLGERVPGEDDDETESPFARAVAAEGGPAPDPIAAAKKGGRR